MISLNLLGKQGKNPRIWYEVCGYVLTITELAEIFKISHLTLRQRLKYGWDVHAACLVPNTVKLTFKEVTLLTQDPSLEPKFKEILRKHFDRPSLTSFGE